MGGLYNLQTFFGLYNFLVNTSKWVLFLPPSDAYVRSFLYLLYTLIKLYYTKALSALWLLSHFSNFEDSKWSAPEPLSTPHTPLPKGQLCYAL